MRLVILFLFCISAYANLEKAPQVFEYQNSKAIYVDFISANYHLTYNFQQQDLSAKSEITLNQTQEGHIIFDLVPAYTSIKLDGVEVESKLIRSPDNASNYRIIKTKTMPGTHILEVTNKVERNLNYTNSGVSSSFWLSDLNDRRYLESYVVSNLEYDQYQMNFTVDFEGFPKHQVMFANGDIVEVSHNKYIITYPDHFTASSIYYHTSHEDRFDIVEDIYQSIDGREIPVTVYRSKGESLTTFLSRTMTILAELEADYGPFPHPKVIIYGAGMGGMEYCGATMTELRALGHELHHSYFARGVMPARGNSGWVDEAIASWRDKGYQSRRTTGFRSTQMAGHSSYRRFTDRDAYGRGAKFMAYLSYLLRDIGGLKPFLKEFKDSWLFKPFFTSDFQGMLEEYANRSFESEFNQYVYGRNGVEKNYKVEKNPFHPVLSDEFYKDLL